MNKVIELGRVTKDIQYRTTTTGKNVAQFTLAVDRVPAKGQTRQQAGADFFNVVAWGFNADFAAKYLVKGSQIVVEGRLSSRSYEKNGQKVYVTEIVAEHFDFAGPKPQQSAGDNWSENSPADSFGQTADEAIPMW